jgi:hypothetical protein
MSVLGHRDKSIDPELIESARPLQSNDERLANLVIRKVREPVVTGEGHKMRLPRLMEALEPTWHEDQFSEKLAV